MNIAEGWRFYSADFSLQASGKSEVGSVTLVRDPKNKVLWHKLIQAMDDGIIAKPSSEDYPELYISAEGKTVEAAVYAANEITKTTKELVYENH